MAGLTVPLTLFFALQLPTLAFDFEFEKFFPKNHPDTELYKKHVEQFGYDNDFMQIILSNDSGVFDFHFLRNASAFEDNLKDIEDVVHVYSPLSLQHVVKSPTGLVIFPLLHLEDSTRLTGDSIRIYENEFYRSAFSDNGKALNIYLAHAHFDDPERTERLLSAIKQEANSQGLDNNIRLVGKLSATSAFINYIKSDFSVYLLASLAVGFTLLLIIFRQIQSALLPFLISVIALVWLFGSMALLGFKINILSSLLPPILLFVSMSDAVHLMNAISKTDENTEKNQRVVSGVRMVWVPTLLTSITTAVGFLSLLWINTAPIQQLGLFAAAGILYAFIITFSLGLLIVTILPPPKKTQTIKMPTSLTPWLISQRRLIITLTVLGLGLAVPGIMKLNVNAYLLSDLPENSAVRRDFEFADTYMGGSKPYEVRVDVANDSLSIWDKSVMDEVVKIEQYLLQHYPVVKVQSPATVIKYLTMANNGGLNSEYRYPGNDKETYHETIQLKERIDPKRMSKLVTKDGKTARLIGFIPEYGSKETQKRNQLLIKHLDMEINKKILNYQITGTTYLIDKSHSLLSKNLLTGLLTAIVVIGLILGIYFRSWKLLIISMVPNLIPLVLIAGILGWVAVPLQMTTSIIFTIVFGIAVDDTIHLMSHYLQQKKLDPIQRMEHTFHHAGNAMIITSLTMVLGFMLFLFSSFGATFYLGLFVSLSLVIALLVDFTLLPLLLTAQKK